MGPLATQAPLVRVFFIGAITAADFPRRTVFAFRSLTPDVAAVGAFEDGSDAHAEEDRRAKIAG